jgi:hypothetical protein
MNRVWRYESKEKTMVNRKFWPGILVMTLVFGMMIVGCKEDEPEKETNPSPPTGLAGTAGSPTSVQLTWNSVSNAAEYLVQYKKNSESNFAGYAPKTGIKSASDTITGLVPATKYDFKVAVKNTDGFTSSYSSTVSVDTLAPSTGSISLSNLRTQERYVEGSYGGWTYTILILLKLSEGATWNSAPTGSTAKSWVTVSGITLTDWTFQSEYTPELDKDTLRLWYTKSGVSQFAPISISSGITVSIDITKLTEMKGYTNITDSLTIGSPSYASSSEWTN